MKNEIENILDYRLPKDVTQPQPSDSFSLMSVVQETQDSNGSMVSPSQEGQRLTLRSESTVKGQDKMETSNLNFQQEAPFEYLSDDIIGTMSQAKKKKNGRDPSLISLVVTRSKIKADVGSKGKSAGRPSSSQSRQEETRRNIADGTQRTILQVCSIKKP